MSSLLPAGNYWGKVFKQSLGTNDKGNTVFVLSCDIMGRSVRDASGEEALEEVGQAERSVYMYITPKTIDFVSEKLAAIGYARDSLKFLNPETPNYHDFTGKEVPLYCKHDSYDGKLREKWDISTGGGGVKLDPVDAKAVRQLDVLFGKAMKSQPKPAAAPPEQKPEPNGSAPDPNAELQQAAETDEVPF